MFALDAVPLRRVASAMMLVVADRRWRVCVADVEKKRGGVLWSGIAVVSVVVLDSERM